MTKGTNKRTLRLSTPLTSPEDDSTSNLLERKPSVETGSPKSSITKSVSTPTKGACREKTAFPKAGKVRFLQHSRAHYSFLKVRLEVSPHLEGGTGVSEALGKLLKIIQAADSTVQLAVYKGEFSNPEREAINKVSAIPEQIIAF